MSLKNKLLIIFLLHTVPILIIGVISELLISRLSLPLHVEIPQQIASLSKSSSLTHKALYIKYYDEVLTQSARNYAFTGDIAWKNRYTLEAPKLSALIQETIAQGDGQDRATFSKINTVNTKLVELETSAIALADQNKLVQAQEILDSSQYTQEKDLYQSHVTAFLDKNESALNTSITGSSQALSSISAQTVDWAAQSAIVIAVLFVISIFISIIAAFKVSAALTLPLLDMEHKAQDMANGDFDKTIPVSSNDELGRLAQSFNLMSTKLKHAGKEAEKKVTERTAELEKLNKLMVGRELQMAELKARLEGEKQEGKL